VIAGENLSASYAIWSVGCKRAVAVIEAVKMGWINIRWQMYGEI